ncbi:MAG: hypothetical protein R6X34_03345, partial [Chloroflexota bacterium]
MTDSPETAVSSPLSWRTTRIRRWLWLPFLVGVAACLAWVALDGRSLRQPIVADDINQHRANTPLPVPANGLQIEQTFYSRWGGLREVELLIAGDGREGDANGRLQFQLLDDNGVVVAAHTAATASLKPDQTYVFRFPALPDSAGR